MIEFSIQDMTCGHCAGRISKAINSVDSGAKVDIRIEQKKVLIDSQLTADALAEAIREAGYTPLPT